MYRVHDSPDPEKLAALRDFLDEIGIPGLALAKGQVIAAGAVQPRPGAGRETPEAAHRQRAGPALAGAGGLQPEQHRPFRPGAAALRAFHLADPPLRRSARASRADRRGATTRRGAGRRGRTWAGRRAHLGTERRAAAAERAALDRYRATLLSGAIGTVLRGADHRRGAIRAVRDACRRAAPTGWSRYRRCRRDYYDHDPARHRLVGRRSGRRVFALGDAGSGGSRRGRPVGGRLVFRLERGGAGPRRKFAAWQAAADRAAAPLINPPAGDLGGGCMRRFAALLW